VKLTTHHQIVPRSVVLQYVHPPSIYVPEVVLNWLSARTSLLFLFIAVATERWF
jgi:hypothetical protein